MSSIRTFIVEDSPIILSKLIGLLEEVTPVHVVGTAVDEDSANARLEQLAGNVDLIIVDMFLQSGSGLGVLRCARSNGFKACLVVLTNFASPDMRKRCAGLGAHRVFDKSNDIDALVDYCSALAKPPDRQVPAVPRQS